MVVLDPVSSTCLFDANIFPGMAILQQILYLAFVLNYERNEEEKEEERRREREKKKEEN